MYVGDLTREQLVELKQLHLIQYSDETGEGVSWAEMADADNIVSDETIFEDYAGTDFTEDDFWCKDGTGTVYLVDRTYFDIKDGKEYGDIVWSMRDMWDTECDTQWEAIEGTKRQIQYERDEYDLDPNEIPIFTVCGYQKMDGDIINDGFDEILRIVACSEERAKELGIKGNMFVE